MAIRGCGCAACEGGPYCSSGHVLGVGRPREGGGVHELVVEYLATTSGQYQLAVQMYRPGGLKAAYFLD
eukprot:3149076-Rhodomonas_salina.1